MMVIHSAELIEVAREGLLLALFLSLPILGAALIAGLLDNAGWFTVAPLYDTWVATSDLHMRLLRPAAATKLTSTGRVVKSGKRQAVAEMEVRTEDGELIAVGTGCFAVTSVPLPT